MAYHFYKMQGCGNDFLFLDGIKNEIAPLSSEEAVYWCDRHFGVGADGLVVLRRGKDTDAEWEFYNSDGSRAEMCGNAARCAFRFLSERHFPGDRSISLKTPAGVIHGRAVEPGRIEIILSAGKEIALEYKEKILHVEDTAFTLACTNTGVPHAVLEVKDLMTYPITRLGRALQAHPAFLPEGTNITFFQRVAGNQILSTTFERGVEEETLACGTGAAAAAFIFSEMYLQKFPIQVKVPGGTLEVGLTAEKRITLTGPGDYVFELDATKPSEWKTPARPYSTRRKNP